MAAVDEDQLPGDLSPTRAAGGGSSCGRPRVFLKELAGGLPVAAFSFAIVGERRDLGFLVLDDERSAAEVRPAVTEDDRDERGCRMSRGGDSR
jgi:hypothetical protein